MMKSFKIGNIEIRVPIIQGGMGVGVSLSSLASAVANEGGVGVISCAGIGLLYPKFSSDYLINSIMGLREEIRRSREKTRGVIGVNVMVALSNFSDMIKTAITEKVDIIFSGAGMPLDLPSYLDKNSTTKLVPIVSSARAARLLCDKWKSKYDYLPDAIVVEGPKAGGHLGFKLSEITNEDFSLEVVLPQVVKEVKIFEELYGQKIPVIAAGGIHSGEDIYRMIELGASGVQMGSRFVVTNECDASQEFKDSFINSKMEDIEIISSPVGMPGRAIVGEFINRVRDGLTKPKLCPYRCIKTCDYTKSPYCIILALYNAAKGNMKKGYVFAGANAFLTNKMTSVKETIDGLKVEFFNAENNRLGKQ